MPRNTRHSSCCPPSLAGAARVCALLRFVCHKDLPRLDAPVWWRLRCLKASRDLDSIRQQIARLRARLRARSDPRAWRARGLAGLDSDSADVRKGVATRYGAHDDREISTAGLCCTDRCTPTILQGIDVLFIDVFAVLISAALTLVIHFTFDRLEGPRRR